MFNRISRALHSFARDERGVITVQSLFLFMACCCVGAAAVDVTHLYAAREQLQVAADAGAHTALLRRHRGQSATRARRDAIELVNYGMPKSVYGNVLREADIRFGAYDAARDRFRVSTRSRSAVLVTTQQSLRSGNPVPTFLFRMIGVDFMDVQATSVFTTFYPECLREGFVAETVVDIQSQNSFFRGFCAHGNGHVELNQGNFFETGTKVSMPDLSDLVIPASGMEQNDGLEQALSEGYYDMRVLDRLRAGHTLPEGVVPFETAISTMYTDETPWFLESDTVIDVAVGALTPAAFTPGRVHRITCGAGSSSSTSRSSRGAVTGSESDVVLIAGNGNGGGNGGGGTDTGGGGSGGGNDGGGGGGSGSNSTLKLLGGTYSQIVLMTNCPIQFDGDVFLEDAILYTTDTSADSIKTPSGQNNGLQIGKDDGCADRGGATILTRGGVRAAAKLALYGGQIRALGDVDFAANAVGEGVSVISGGRIDGTSRMEMSGCRGGMDQNFEEPYFRLAR